MFLLSFARGGAQNASQESFFGLAKYTIFSAGDNDVNNYRILSIVTSQDGSLLVFCEARREGWQDKSRTNVVVKRSTDKGRLILPTRFITLICHPNSSLNIQLTLMWVSLDSWGFNIF